MTNLKTFIPALIIAIFLLSTFFSVSFGQGGFPTTALNSLAANSFVTIHQPGGNTTGLNLTEALGFQQFNVSGASTLTFTARETLVVGDVTSGGFTTTIPVCAESIAGRKLELVKQDNVANNWLVDAPGGNDFWFSGAVDGFILNNTDRQIGCRCGQVGATYYWIITSRQ